MTSKAGIVYRCYERNDLSVAIREVTIHDANDDKKEPVTVWICLNCYYEALRRGHAVLTGTAVRLQG